MCVCVCVWPQIAFENRQTTQLGAIPGTKARNIAPHKWVRRKSEDEKQKYNPSAC